ncbi:unnamed protein product [Effrenium voratum]|uniref:DUF4116 domain-containing protein n=1 Tax=Effrenium voratum TaxID=2562239 RepID=A0AA36HZD9_9DINO|nr:unnamed protein product [Effrenium voratum]CAJ1453465.1 unnamed protein product [Effrenium voratum]
MQAGFLNRSSTAVVRQGENRLGRVVKQEEVKTTPIWGRSQDVLRERDVNVTGPVPLPRKDVGQPTARFDVGDICEVIGAALVRKSEDLGGERVVQLLDGCRVEVTDIGSGPSGKRIAIQDADGHQGWVSVVSSNGEALIRIIEKELRSDAREKRIEAAARAARHDQGKPTSRFEVGDLCHVIASVIVRKEEALESSQIARLPDRREVEVLEIGTGDSGKRVCIKDGTGIVGWISVVSSDGTQLLRKARPVQSDQPPQPQAQAPAQPQPPTFMEAAPSMPQEPAPASRADEFQPLAKFSEPSVLVSSARAQRGFDVEVSFLQREHMEQLLSEKFASEGIQEPNYDCIKLRDAKGRWYRPGEAPDVPSPDLFPITLYYRPPKPTYSAETVLALRQRQAYEALSPTQRRGLKEVQRQLELAYSQENNDLLDRAMRLAHSCGLPLGTAGLPVSLMPETVCFPKGNEPLLYDGHLYSMHSTSLLVFDPPDFSVPMGVWNPQRQRVDPAVMQNENKSSDIVHFGKTFHMLEQGQIIDPDSQQVIGMIRPLTGDFEFFDPIPLQVANFMMKRGFRLEAPSAQLTKLPFVQILPEVEAQEGNPELHLHMQSAGNAKALKYAPVEERGNKDALMKAMRQGAGPQSWKIMLIGSEALQSDRDVLAEAVKQDYSAMAYASAFSDDRDFMMQAAQQHGLTLRYGSEHLRADPDICYAAVKASWRALQHVSPKLRGSSRMVREAVKQCWQALEYASEELQDDKDTINLALKQTWHCLQFASLRLRSDASFMLKAVDQSADALQFATDALLCNHEFMQQAVEIDGMALQFAAMDIVDRDLVLKAVQKTWRALQHAPESLRSDRAVVLEAVRQHHAALQLASPEILLDEDLVFEAARRRPDFLRFVPECVRESKGLMMRMVKLQPMTLQYVTGELRYDEELVLEAVRRNWRSLQHAAPELRASPSFMLAAVQVDALTLSLAAENVRKDPQVVCEAVEREWEMLEHAAEDLRSNHAFMMEAVGIEGLSLKYASADLCAEPDIVLAAISNCGRALEFAAEGLRAEPDIVLMAVRQDFEAIAFADDELRNDFTFMLRAVRVDGRALTGASVELKADPDLVLSAVQQNWRSLKYACRALRSNIDFMMQAVRVSSFALAMAAQELWMDPRLLAAAAEETQTNESSLDAPESLSADAELRQLLRQARPGWSEESLQSAEQKLCSIGATSVPLLAQALAADLNGRLRAAGQKIFTATTVMELKARTATLPAVPKSGSQKAAKKGSRPNARLAF